MLFRSNITNINILLYQLYHIKSNKNLHFYKIIRNLLSKFNLKINFKNINT